MASLRSTVILAHTAAAVLSAGAGWAAQEDTLDATTATIVFYYGDQPELQPLHAFDIAVVEPDTGFVPPSDGDTQWFAYVSVGEVTPLRDYFAQIPPAWIVGHNHEWQAPIVDQTAAGWPEFFVSHAITPLWEQGFRGFFLDTLDSYELVSPGKAARQASQAGLVAVIRAIHKRFPDARLILNRGFELLPDVHSHVYALAFESLFQGWSEARGEYTDVGEDDREWLIEHISRARSKYGLPIIAIDYCDPDNSQCANQTVKRIRKLGLIPYVGDGQLQRVNLASLGKDKAARVPY